MSNRHQRRKNIKLGRIEIMRVEDFKNLPSKCAWDDCCCVTAKPDEEGWSRMVLYSGKTQENFFDIDPRLMARDCVLCPEHAQHLDANLLINIGR